MPSLKDIRKRIISVKNTQKITSAMKMVSAAKLRRAQDAAESARPYALKMNQVIASVASRVEDSSHPLLQSRENPKKALIIVVTSNRGLCGGYNGNVFRIVNRFIRDQKLAGVEVEIATMGRKGDVFFRNAAGFWKSYPDVIGKITYAKAREVAKEVTERFVSEEVDAVYIVYNEFISAISYNTIIHPLLPLKLDDLAEHADGHGSITSEYIFEPDEKSLLEHLLPVNVVVQILRALLEAEASEHGARMSAMDNATNNARDLISRLTLQFNRGRQAYITKELMEIVSGSEALK